MTDETKSLAVLTDETGYTYDLTCLPDQSSPLIAQASNEILQDMQVNSIIQNLENVSRLMFIAYNALAGTMVQSKMSRLQKKFLDLMDDSTQTITTFQSKSKNICTLVIQAYQWLLKGKEKMALNQFQKCANDAAAMADKAELLAAGFQALSDQSEEVLESTQDEQTLQYQKMDELKQQMEQYNASLKKCESLRDSLNEDIKDINQAYQDARKKEQSAFEMKKGLMITQIVTSCIGALIPSGRSIQNNASSQNSQAVENAQNSLNNSQKEQQQLSADQQSQQNTVDELSAKKETLKKEIQEIQQKIQIESSLTAREEEEKQANLNKYNQELAQKQQELNQIDAQLQAAQSKLENTSEKLSKVADSINRLNEQLSAYADQCRDDLEKAQQATEKALEKKLELEKQRRDTLASIEEFTVMIQSSVEQKNTAETAVQTLQMAIRCIKQVVVALTTAAKFWRSMEEYCRTLSDSGLGQEILELSQGLTEEERLEYYQDKDFMMAFLTYICRWAALYYVCEDYLNRAKTVRSMVADNITSSGSREEEWAMAGDLAKEMEVSIQEQVESSRQITAALAG